MAQDPLGPNDLIQINEQLARLDTADKFIIRAQSAGIDVSERKRQAQEARSKLNKLKQSFFPG